MKTFPSRTCKINTSTLPHRIHAQIKMDGSIDFHYAFIKYVYLNNMPTVNLRAATDDYYITTIHL